MKKQDQALLAAILDTAVDAIIVIDQRGTIELVNEATHTMFGYQDNELIGHNIKQLMPTPYRQEHDSYLANYAATGVAKIIGIGREVIGRRKDGSTFPMHLAVSEVVVGDEKRFAGIVRDISDLKTVQNRLASLNEKLEQRVEERTAQLRKAQAELVQSEKLATLGQVAGGIAHEIRNPLSVIRTSVFYLQKAKDASEEKRAEHMERIERQVSMIDNVVTALADVARLPEARVCRTDVGEVLGGIVANIQHDASIDLVLDIESGLPPAQIDPNQVAIVFRNLLRNARDSIESGGTVRVWSTHDDASLHLHVTDDGIGIAPENLRRITEPLYSTKARGMGLGLAICAAILKKNGASMSVESEVGQGTTFTVRLPRYDEG